MARVEMAHRHLPATDLLIAACAAEHGASLLHRDRHFDRIADAGG